jgi:transcriptional regulator with XRE-family HTH domain
MLGELSTGHYLLEVNFSSATLSAMPSDNQDTLDEHRDYGSRPSPLTKQEFGRRLHALMLSRGWNQSELARQAGLPRDSVSNYIRGRSRPTPKSLQMLAEGLGMRPQDLYPSMNEAIEDREDPILEVRVTATAPNTAMLRVNRLVSLSTAAKVVELINSDRLGNQNSS